ncbi:MAG TPA: hypothetical protein VD886_14325 [Herpetosiphonaceae bacterium]|nr:hypothetical protein [Herpetosiphonaceae bacterium]
MSLVSQESKIQRWGIDTLLLGLGGAGVSFITLFLANQLFGRTSRITDDGMPTPLVVVLALIGVGLYFLARMRYAGCLPCLVVIGWWGAHLVLTIIASAVFASSGMSLPIYLVMWLVMGAIGAALINGAKGTRLAAAGAAGAIGAGAYVASRGRSEVLKSSGYGRIPPATVILLTQHVRTANDAAGQLPSNAPVEIRKVAVGVILDHLIRDWWENENREGLTPTDIGDMGAFVQLAWTAARGAPSLPEAEAAMRAVLTALMDDWFNSWNADGVDGAPRWQWNA